MPDELEVSDGPSDRTCLGLPFAGERPLTDLERLQGERRLARRRLVGWCRSAALAFAGAVVLSWLVPEAHLDFYRDADLSLMALCVVGCFGGAAILGHRSGEEVRNLRLDLAEGRAERYERKASASVADVVGQTSILLRSRLEVGLGSRRSGIERPSLSNAKASGEHSLLLLRHPAPPSGESRPMTESELAELLRHQKELAPRLIRSSTLPFLLLLIVPLGVRKTETWIWLGFLASMFLWGWIRNLRLRSRLRADRQAGVVLLGRARGTPALEWEILPRSRFVWTERGEPARWRSEPQKNEGADLRSSEGEKPSLRERMDKEWRWLRPALRRPIALLAVVPIGCLVLSIAGFLAMPSVPSPWQLGTPFLWLWSALLSGIGLLIYLSLASTRRAAGHVDLGESSVPRREVPTSTGGTLRRALLLSERDRLAMLRSSQESAGAIAALPALLLGWIAASSAPPFDRGWLFGAALLAFFLPDLISGLRSLGAAIQLRRDLKEGAVVAGRSASDSDEIEWLSRSGFPWTVDGVPVAWRRE